MSPTYLFCMSYSLYRLKADCLTAGLGRNVVSHLNLYVVIHFPNGPIEQSSCGLTVEILFAAVVADFSRDVFDNDDCFVVSERKDSTPGSGFSVPANDTLHLFLLMKPGCQRSVSGSYTVMTTKHSLSTSSAKTTCRGRAPAQPNANLLGSRIVRIPLYHFTLVNDCVHFVFCYVPPPHPQSSMSAELYNSSIQPTTP